MSIPIHCSTDSEVPTTLDDAAWVSHACRQLDKDMIGEKKVFVEGMDMFQLIEAFYNQDPNCFISDWPPGFFVDYYNLADPWDKFPLESTHTVRMRPLVRNSVKYYPNIEEFDVFGEKSVVTDGNGSLCRHVTLEKYNSGKPCPPGSLACHYQTASEMRQLHAAKVDAA
mmetsp:Transcript_36924/g.76787  ORF Transcript_36924/g.76787 Transcript_36924/m.76787 type:complete len:169 (+) Transcript_36924:96-602(+)